MDHFTVVCSMTRPLNGSEAVGDLGLMKPHCCLCCLCVNQAVVMLTNWHLNEKIKGVCIKARSPPASLAFTCLFLQLFTQNVIYNL